MSGWEASGGFAGERGGSGNNPQNLNLVKRGCLKTLFALGGDLKRSPDLALTSCGSAGPHLRPPEQQPPQQEQQKQPPGRTGRHLEGGGAWEAKGLVTRGQSQSGLKGSRTESGASALRPQPRRHLAPWVRMSGLGGSPPPPRAMIWGRGSGEREEWASPGSNT